MNISLYIIYIIHKLQICEGYDTVLPYNEVKILRIF